MGRGDDVGHTNAHQTIVSLWYGTTARLSSTREHKPAIVPRNSELNSGSKMEKMNLWALLICIAAFYGALAGIHFILIYVC